MVFWIEAAWNLVKQRKTVWADILKPKTWAFYEKVLDKFKKPMIFFISQWKILHIANFGIKHKSKGEGYFLKEEWSRTDSDSRSDSKCSM